MFHFFANSPALWGGCVTRHKHRLVSYPGRPSSYHAVPRRSRAKSGVQGEYAVPRTEGRGRTVCRPATKLVEHYAGCGTSLIGVANLSPVTKLVAGTGAVSRYNVDRRWKPVMVYRNLIACRCAYPRATTIRNLSWV